MNILVVFPCLVAIVAADHQFGQPAFPKMPFIAILRDDRRHQVNGAFNYVFETENGIRETRMGTPGSRGQINMEGSYQFRLPDGNFANVRYVADENGFRVESPLIPTPHPLPAHAVAQIRAAETKRLRGNLF